MDEEIARNLVLEIDNQKRQKDVDGGFFLNLLIETDVPESLSFHEDLPHDPQTITKFNRYHHFSLRRVLRNRDIRHHTLSSRWGKAYEAIASRFGGYPSDALNRSLRSNEEIVEMMAKSSGPFSLLGKLKTYDFRTREREGKEPDNPTYIITRPVLIIPGVKDSNPVYAWENANKTYEKKGFLGIQKRITPQQYWNQS